MEKQAGAATLIITVLLMMVALLMMLSSAQFSMSQQKSSPNFNPINQAYEAAEAGLEYGFAYLKNSSATVLASASGGYINYTLPTVTLADNSSFSVNFTNNTAYNYNLLTIKVTGTNPDNTATKVLSQQVYPTSAGDAPVISLGTITMSGGGTVSNLNSSTTTIETAGVAVLTGTNTATYLSSGISSTAGDIKSDIQQLVPSLQGLSANDFFQKIFNVDMTTKKTQIQSSGIYYKNTVSNGNYSSLLNGVTGKSIWIDQTNGKPVSISSTGTVVGSIDSPVLLIVNGDFSLSGTGKIYGVVFVSGTTVTISGGSTIIGSIYTTGNILLSGGAGSYQKYDTPILPTTGYAKLPGSWQDF